MADYNYIGFEGKTPLKIRRWLGTGTTLLQSEMIGGKYYRKDVMYLFISLLFLPIVPLGCYCVSSETRNPWNISFLKKAKWRWKELMIIYIECWLLFPIFFLLIILGLCFFIFLGITVAVGGDFSFISFLELGLFVIIGVVILLTNRVHEHLFFNFKLYKTSKKKVLDRLEGSYYVLDYVEYPLNSKVDTYLSLRTVNSSLEYTFDGFQVCFYDNKFCKLEYWSSSGSTQQYEKILDKIKWKQDYYQDVSIEDSTVYFSYKQGRKNKIKGRLLFNQEKGIVVLSYGDVDLPNRYISDLIRGKVSNRHFE
ncbi:MAG: hypothetical protein IJM35_09925 [Bacteroidales bacterium]|nr:hypothetical protein [Bacteroidales bacterium]